jgi:hypothetical protein
MSVKKQSTDSARTIMWLRRKIGGLKRSIANRDKTIRMYQNAVNELQSELHARGPKKYEHR